jgi:hypothetical protein
MNSDRAGKLVGIGVGVLIVIVLVRWVLPALLGVIWGFAVWVWEGMRSSFTSGFDLLGTGGGTDHGLGWARWLVLAALAVMLACLALGLVAWTVKYLFDVFREKQTVLLALLFGAGATLLAGLCEDYLPEDNKVLKRLLTTITMLVFAATKVLQSRPERGWRVLGWVIDIGYPIAFLLVVTDGKFLADITAVQPAVWVFIGVWLLSFVVLAFFMRRGQAAE